MSRAKKDIADMHKSPFPVALRALMSEKPATTQEKLAEITGKTRQTVSQYVNGISEPGYDTLIKIADYFDVSIDYLLGRTKDRRKTPSVYDQIGLSEKSVSILLLAHNARSNPEGRKELIDYLWRKGVTGLYSEGSAFQAPGEPLYQPENDLHQHLAQSAATRFSRLLPEFIDCMVDVAAEYEIVLRNFSQIVDGDCRPAGLSNVMPLEDFIKFKTYEITQLINEYFLYYFSDINY